MLSYENIIGTWKLDKFILVNKADLTEKNWGQNTNGILIYTREGYMSASINSKITAAEVNAEIIGKHSLFYAGTYEIKQDIVLHHVTNASDPKRIGKIMQRRVVLEDKVLKLTTERDYGEVILTWHKTPELF